MFSTRRLKTMVRRRNSRRDTDISAWERRWNAMKLRCLEYISKTGPIDIPFVCHDQKLQSLLNMRQLIARVADFRPMGYFELVCFKWPYNQPYLVHIASDWWQQLNVGGYHRCGSKHSCNLWWHNLEVFASPHRALDGFYAPRLNLDDCKSSRKSLVWRIYSSCHICRICTGVEWSYGEWWWSR